MQDYHLEHSQDLGKAEQAFSQCYKHALGNLEAETGGYFYFDKSLNFSVHSCTNLNSYEKNQFNFRDSQFYNYYIKIIDFVTNKCSFFCVLMINYLKYK